MKPPQISLEKIVALEPACLRMTVPEAYRDENGHMNVRWYAAIFDEAGDTLHARLGLTPERQCYTVLILQIFGEGLSDAQSV